MMNEHNGQTDGVGWRLEQSYRRLPAHCFAEQPPVPVRGPRVVILNHALGESLGLDLSELDHEQAAAFFAGNLLPDGSVPIAQAYAGHQFGHFTMLGDGRAILLGEQVTPSGVRFDLQLKGSGRTRYSRGGDGRAALGPMLREYIISEAMAALGIPSTRSLAVVTTGESVFRGTALPGAVLTRVAASHIRVGTFEYFRAIDDPQGLKTLADYTIDRHFPELRDAEDRYLGLLRAVAERQAALVASWLHIGFIHGVMNTDNMAVSGETIDYGPCAFMDRYDPATVFSSIDRHGRYAYANQPGIAQWNLACFAESLHPLLDDDPDRAAARADVIAGFADRFQHHWLAGMRRKIGLANEEPGDLSLIQSLLKWMYGKRLDYTNTFREIAVPGIPAAEVYDDPEFLDWHARWHERRARQGLAAEEVIGLMKSANPAVIPRNHLVEEALEAATERSDLGPLHRFLEVLARPYEERDVEARYRLPAPPDQQNYQTFCGT
jgi:serine/tyrosine/threonine adenylyltransferase